MRVAAWDLRNPAEPVDPYAGNEPSSVAWWNTEVIGGGADGWEYWRVTRQCRQPQCCVGALRFVVGKSDYREHFVDWWLGRTLQMREPIMSQVATGEFIAAVVLKYTGKPLDYTRLRWMPVPPGQESIWTEDDDRRWPGSDSYIRFREPHRWWREGEDPPPPPRPGPRRRSSRAS